LALRVDTQAIEAMLEAKVENVELELMEKS
jgi:hypothetical protein